MSEYPWYAKTNLWLKPAMFWLLQVDETQLQDIVIPWALNPPHVYFILVHNISIAQFSYWQLSFIMDSQGQDSYLS